MWIILDRCEGYCQGTLSEEEIVVEQIGRSSGSYYSRRGGG